MPSKSQLTSASQKSSSVISASVVIRKRKQWEKENFFTPIIDVEGEKDFALVCTVEHVSAFIALLKSLLFCEKVNLFAYETGLKFTVEEGKCVQATAFLDKSIFRDFNTKDDFIPFKISLKDILNCIGVFYNDKKTHLQTGPAAGNAFGTDTATTTGTRGGGEDTSGPFSNNALIKISYEGFGSTFNISILENGMGAGFKLRTEEVDELISFELDPVICTAMFKPEYLKELFMEIDANDPESVDFEFKSENSVKMSCTGTAGKMEVIIPLDSNVLDSLACDEDCKASYRWPNLRKSFKALSISQKLALKLNRQGLLSFSFLFPAKPDSFIEFYSIPQFGMDSPEEGGKSPDSPFNIDID